MQPRQVLAILLVPSAAIKQKQCPAEGKNISVSPVCDNANVLITVLPLSSGLIGLLDSLHQHSEYTSPSPSPSTVGLSRCALGLYDIRPENPPLWPDSPAAIGIARFSGLACHAPVSQGRPSYPIEPNTFPGSRTTNSPRFLIGSTCDTVFVHTPCFFPLLLNGYKPRDPQIEGSLWETGDTMAAKHQRPAFSPPRTPLTLSPSLSAIRPSPLLSGTSLSCTVTSSPLTSSPTLSNGRESASPDLLDDLKFSEDLDDDFRRIDRQAAEFEQIHTSPPMRRIPHTPTPPPTLVRDRKTWVVFRGKTPGIYDDG